MAKRAYNEARKRANRKYDEKTYRKVTILLRKEEDAEIIADLEGARENGVSCREWIRSTFYK